MSVKTSARGFSTPRPGLTLKPQSAVGHDAGRIAEMKLASCGTPRGAVNFGGAAPLAVKPPCGAASPVPSFIPSSSLNFPLWSDATIQMYVHASVESTVQPRLDSFAEKLGSIVAAAQAELRDLERFVERAEARTEGRLTGVETRLAVLVDSSARAEQRERDLNTRIGGMAEGALQSAFRTAGEAATEAARTPRWDEVERRAHEAVVRVDAVEESCRKNAKGARWLEHRLEDLEERSRAGERRLTEEMRDLFVEARNCHLRSRTTGDVGDGGNCSGAESAQAFAATLARLAALDEQICLISSAVAAVRAERCGQLAAVESLVEKQRTDLETIAMQLNSHCEEFRKEKQRGDHKEAAERIRATALRVDDINRRLGSLKVKTDGLEGRLQTMSDRAETARQSAEAQLRQQLTERCERSVAAGDVKIEAIERRIASLEDTCEDMVEQALERRLSVLSGNAQPSARRRRSQADLDGDETRAGDRGGSLATARRARSPSGI